MRQWVMSVTAASLISAIAMALTPAGRVRQVTKLACGLLCALAVASPVLQLDIGSLAANMAVYEQRAQMITEQAEEETKMLDRTYIEEACGAYILTKAAEGSLAVDSAAVLARWDEDGLVWYPWSVTVDAPFDEGLSAVIEANLGIPRQRQSWRDDG